MCSVAFLACIDLASKENELDRLLDVCSSSIATLTKNMSSTRYPLNCLLLMLLKICYECAVILEIYVC